MVTHLARIVVGYVAAFVIATVLLNAWTQATLEIFSYAFSADTPGWSERWQWFAMSSLVILVLTIIPASLLIFISERRGEASRKQCAWAGCAMGAWPLVLTGGLLPMYIAAPGIGYLSGLVYWKIAGRHVRSGNNLGEKERLAADARK